MSDELTRAGWLDRRTGYREIIARWKGTAPSKAHWAYTIGIALLALLAIQAVTGVTLMLYYIPSPLHAYDSIRYIVSELPAGSLIRGLHYYGASFLIAFVVLHLLTTLYFGAHKAPRELTWLSGLVLLVLLAAFGLTGYLLPWDQMGYWATVVRTNIAGATPVLGPWLMRLIEGGASVGAITLSRWYAFHVAVLPAALLLFTLGHLYQFRRHGRAGHYDPERPAPSLLPSQRSRNALAVVAVTAGLLALAAFMKPALESMADSGDLAFVPRPEWYFLWLFQLMKLGGGVVERLGATMVLIMIAAFLALLPFLDSKKQRQPRTRAGVLAITASGLVGMAALTVMALREAPPDRDPNFWSPSAIAGQQIAQRSACTKCHGLEGVAPDLARGRVVHGNSWIENHLSDPETIAPGIRLTPFDAPTKPEAVAVVAYQRMMRSGAQPAPQSESIRKFALVYATACAGCHRMDGDGIADGPDLSHAGRERDMRWIAEKIVKPDASDPKTRMPSLAEKLSKEEVDLLATVLADRK